MGTTESMATMEIVGVDGYKGLVGVNWFDGIYEYHEVDVFDGFDGHYGINEYDRVDGSNNVRLAIILS